MALIEPHLKERLQVTNLQSSLRLKISEILEVDIPQRDHLNINLPKKVRCCFCPCGKDRKTSFACRMCHKPYCLEHRAKLCCNCENQQ